MHMHSRIKPWSRSIHPLTEYSAPMQNYKRNTVPLWMEANQLSFRLGRQLRNDYCFVKGGDYLFSLSLLTSLILYVSSGFGARKGREKVTCIASCTLMGERDAASHGYVGWDFGRFVRPFCFPLFVSVENPLHDDSSRLTWQQFVGKFMA